MPHTPAMRRALRARYDARAAQSYATRPQATSTYPAIAVTSASAVTEPGDALETAITTTAPAPARAKASPKPISDRELRGKVWALALPAIGEQLLALGVGLSDTFLSGHLSNAAMAHLGYDRAIAVDTVGMASTAAWVVLTAFFAVNIGVTALVARATGAKDTNLARRAAAQGIILGVIAGIVMLGLAVPLASLITHVLGVSGQVADLGASFIRIYSLGLPATGVASACTAAMRGSGDGKRPLIVMLVVNGANILGSWILMNGLQSPHISPLGVLGSACGAASGWALGAVLALYLLSRDHPRAPKLVRSALHLDRALAARILRVGLPSAAELIVFQIGIVSFLRFVVILGPAAYAANTAINTVESMGSLPGFGFAVAATALVGQALGASDPDLAKRVVWATMRPCVAVMGAMGLLAALFPSVFLGMFVADSSVQVAGDIAMRFSLLTLPGSAIAFVFIGTLRGAGDTKFPVIARATSTLGIRVPLALALIPVFGLPGARIAMATDFWTQAAITYWRFRSGRWHKAKV
ncbi:MAG TPA: MATE family efflux transporter [Ktedonobacterales bacterium]